MRKISDVKVMDFLIYENVCELAAELPLEILESRSWKKLYDLIPEERRDYFLNTKITGEDIDYIIQVYTWDGYKDSWSDVKKRLSKVVNQSNFREIVKETRERNKQFATVFREYKKFASKLESFLLNGPGCSITGFYLEDAIGICEDLYERGQLDADEDIRKIYFSYKVTR